MAEPAPKPMTVDDYLAWSERQPERPRYELVDGQPVAMAPERVGHTRTKYAVHAALAAAIRKAGLACEALGDGVMVRVGEATAYEPDALVRCGPRLPDDTVEAPDPIVIVEVLSPSTEHIDTAAKLAGYFRLPSLVHYLIVAADRPMVIHHARPPGGSGPIETRILAQGSLALDPPGLSVPVEAFYDS
jgi:Uma2 family endonuclease